MNVDSTLPTALDKFIEYYETSTGNDIVKYEKACEKFQQEHKLKPLYTNYRSFKATYRYHKHGR